MTFAQLALLLGAIPVLILIGYGIRYARRALRERNASWQQLTDPTRCWDCGGAYHFPCPETTWWRDRR